MVRDVDVPSSYVVRVQDALACVSEPGEPRRARRDGACILVERGGRGGSAFPYVRFRRLAEDAWRLEELGGRRATLVWQQRARAKSLDDLLRRWLDADTLQRDIRVSAPDGGAALATLLASPASGRRRRKAASSEPSKEERLGVRRERVRETHRSWLVSELSKLSRFRPSVKLRRIQLEWRLGALHDGLRWGAVATDAAGDDASEHAPAIRSRNLWPRRVGSRIGGTSSGGWHDAAVECVEAWIVEAWRLASPTPPCPVHLSVHDDLDRGLNLATGRRTTFRSD